MKTLLITGGSSGIGKATATLFADNGWQVFELSRHGKDVRTDSGASITHIDCDVTIEADCQNAVKEVVDKAGTINVLISNAGMGISGALEFTDVKDARKQMDVNFFGALNIAKTCIPYMRQAREKENADCRIIFVSSMAAVFAIPYQAFYSASKFAINGMALALQNELRPFGIKVCCLLPGDVKTGFTASREKSIKGMEVYKNMDKAVKTMEHDEQNGITPERMAKKLMQLANASSPCFFSTVGLQYHLFTFLNKILPTTVVNWIVGKMY